MRDVDSQISILDVFLEVFFNLVYVYSVAIMTSYIVLAAISFYYVRNYIRKNQVVDYRDLLNTPIYQSVSVLAPAYNEAATIIDNIRSLMSIHYPNFEVIIINDGSKDDTLARCINAYDMVPVDFAYFEHVACKPIRAVYKSKNRAFSHLTVVDKVNGGKSDALNAGINVSKMKYITCIDVDCILEQDAILKMMKPFAEAEEGVEVIATGGVIRIANSCKIEDGRITQVRAPENMVARFQALEYLRAFLLGRMAWSHLDGLLLISGALGIFNKKVAIEAGGYSHKTVGEDMELVVRMRMLMQDKGLKYKVAFIPDPLCWTEAPESWNVLVRQRNRWTRGTIETLLQHRKLFFNPFYGIVGLGSYPYWFFFEWLAPLLEAVGIILAFFLALIGWINWSFFFLMLLLVYSFTVAFSVLGLLIEEVTYHQYKREKDIFKLILAGLVEPFVFHPTVLYAAIKGNIDFISGKSSWGEMTRKGFGTKASADGAAKVQTLASAKNKSVIKSKVILAKEAPTTTAQQEKKTFWTKISAKHLLISLVGVVAVFSIWAYIFTDFFTTGLIYGKEYSQPLKYKERSILEERTIEEQEEPIVESIQKQLTEIESKSKGGQSKENFGLVLASFSSEEKALEFLRNKNVKAGKVHFKNGKYYALYSTFETKKEAEKVQNDEKLPKDVWVLNLNQ